MGNTYKVQTIILQQYISSNEVVQR